MQELKQLTCIIEREEDGYVSLCPQMYIASQGESVEEARNNLIEAIKLFFETASPREILTGPTQKLSLFNWRRNKRDHL